MAVQYPNQVISFTAGADLSSNQFYLLKLNSSGNAVLATGAGSPLIGVLQNKPENGEAAEVMVAGVAKVIAGATIDEADIITANASGKALSVTTKSLTFSGYAIGQAITAGATGEYVSVLIQPMRV